MAFCKNCGNNLGEGAGFCSNCGTAVEAPQANYTAPAQPQYVQPQAPVQPVAQGPRRLHCPKCKSSEISPINETSINGAVTTNHGGFATSHVSNTHRNYWMCSYCGAKFRNIENLEEEIRKSKSTPVILAVFDVICIILFAYFLPAAMNSLFGFIFYSMVAGSGLGAIIITIYIFVCIKKRKEMIAELEYLKVNCFD